MSRLHKKCLLVSCAGHFLLLAILLVSSAFVVSKEKPKELPPLNLVSSQLLDEALAAAAPPTAEPAPREPEPEPEPVIEPEPLPEPAPEPEPPPPEPERRPPPEPAPRPEPKKEDPPKPPPEKPRPIKKPEIRPQFTKSTTPTPRRDLEAERREEERKRRLAAQARRASELENVERSLRSKLTAQSALQLEGLSGLFSNYASEVRRRYQAAWRAPEEAEDPAAAVTVRIRVSRSGAIVSETVVRRSGYRALDASVDEALRRVRRLPPFPEGSTESERVFSIDFNLIGKSAF